MSTRSQLTLFLRSQIEKVFSTLVEVFLHQVQVTTSWCERQTTLSCVPWLPRCEGYVMTLVQFITLVVVVWAIVQIQK